MAVSYSFHISSKSHAVTNTGKVGQVSKHNLREYKSANYDKSQIEVLVGSSDNLLNDIKRVYHQEFDEALERYNQKQKRADRKIDDYLTHVSNSRNDVAVEVIIQLGDKDFWKDKDQIQQKRMTHIFKDQLKALGEYCPDFKVASAVVHYDESSPHMHVVGVPVARGYEKGMETQCAKTKVFTKESLTFLQDKLRERAEIGMDMFYNISLKSKEKGRNKDIPKHSLDEYYKLQADIKNNNITLDQQAKTLENNAVKIKNMDEITSLIGSKDRESVKAEDFIIPERKSLFGRIEAPERKGVFIEDMQPHQIEALMNRVKADEGLEKVFDEVQERCNQMITQAKEEAKEIKAEAMAEKNEIVAKAESIINQQNSIIERAKAWAKSLEKKYEEILDKVSSLLGQKEALEKEVARIEAYKGEIEPLRAEYEQLSEGVKIMSGELVKQITQAHFKDWSTMPFGASYDDYRKRGELLALYKDGTIRKVGYNEHGGMDNKTLEDKSSGKCRVGIMQNEERVSVPKSLVKEMIATMDKSKDISDNLANFIRQQNKVNEIRKDREIHR